MDSKTSGEHKDEIGKSEEASAAEHEEKAGVEGKGEQEEQLNDPWPSTVSFNIPIKEMAAKRDRETLETFTAHVTRATLKILNGNFNEAENDYVDALKLVYRRQNNSDRVKQCFMGLANIYGYRAEKEKNLEDLVNAVGLFNGALRRSIDEKEKAIIIAELEKLDTLSLKIVHGSQFSGLGTRHSVDMENKARLESLRSGYKMHMESIGVLEDGVQPIERNGTGNVDVEVKFTVAVKELYRLISKDAQEFMKKILNQSIEKVGSPPCAFSLVGLGSLARQEITPFSDFEFIFLIETDTEEIRSYFRSLTYYMHIRVLNLQETLIPSLGLKNLNDTYSEIKNDNWFWEEGPRGISFDGAFSFASKTPLGRKPTKQKNWAVEFIKSPKEMAGFQKEDVMLKEGYHVASILRQVVFVAGEPSLVKEYKDEMDFIHQDKTKEDQADNKHGTMKIIQKETQKMLAKDVEKYAPEIGSIDNEGMLWHVKKEIYRLTSLVLDAISCLYDTKIASSWDIIPQLELQGLLGKRAAHNFSLAHSIGTWLRLKTYMNNKSQAENITVLPQRDEATHLDVKIIAKIFHVKKNELILRFLQISSPLVQIAKDLCFKEDFLSPILPLSSTLCDTSIYRSAAMHVRLMNFKEAQRLLQQCVQEREGNLEKEEVPLFMVYFLLGHVTSMLANFDVSDEYHKKALEASRKYTSDHPESQPVIATLINISIEYRKRAKYEESLKYLKEAQRITESWTDEQVKRLFSSLQAIKTNLGLLQCDTGNLSAGIKILEEVVHENRAAESPGLPELLSNLGAVHLEQGNFEKAEKYMMESLNMMTDLYGVSVSHPAISKILNNLGILYVQTGELETAISVLEENADMTEQLYGEDVHSNRISSLYNLANAYFEISQISRALASYEELLILRRQLLGEDAEHPAIAGNLNNIGACHSKFQDYDTAIIYYNMAFEMRKKIYGEDTDHYEIADSHFNLGCAYFEKLWLHEALTHFKNALEMFKKAFGEDSRHPYICETHENLRRIFEAMGDEKAAKFHGVMLSAILAGADMPSEEQGNSSATEGDDKELQKAIALSLMSDLPNEEQNNSSGTDDEEELQKAIALSLMLGE